MDPQRLRIIYYPEPEDTVVLNVGRMMEMTGGDPIYARPETECTYCNVINPCYACMLKRSIKPLAAIKEEVICQGCQSPADHLVECLKCKRYVCSNCAGGLKENVTNCFNCQVDGWTE